MRIGIDLMGSDSSPDALYEAVLEAAKNLGTFHSLVVIATKSVVNKLPSLKDTSSSEARIEFRIVADSIAMSEEPLKAFRYKKEASMVVGLRLLKKGKIDALVSCGNTGALVGGATLSLSMLPGIHRSALLVSLPTQTGSVAVLDAGGILACKAKYLVQSAYLGAAYQKALHGIEAPVVGLLNIGIESGKGTKEVCQAYEILKSQSLKFVSKGIAPRLHFAGNVEGRDVFKGVVDVLVTDGFTGNVMLKTAEGAASFIIETIKGSLEEKKSPDLTVALENLNKHFNYAEYPGAFLCGVEGVVIKAHGSSSAKALFRSIMGAADLVNKKVVESIKSQLPINLV